MNRITLFLLFAIGSAGYAHAAVTIEEHILQKGVYVTKDCKADKADPGYNACECEADIRYPEIKGMANDEMQKVINADFVKIAEQTKCSGEAKDSAQPANSKSSPSSVSHHYEITFQSSSLLGLRFTDWGYTGGAHGNGSVEGVIIDLDKGKLLAISDIFSAKDIPAINQVIYEALSANAEEIFREQIESRKETFIEENECQGCTLTLMPDGVHVLFQTYELASFAQGNPEVSIPGKYIAYPPLKTVLEVKQ